MRANLVPPVLVLLLAACGPFPDDLDGTMVAIRDRGEIHVGLTTISPDDEQRAREFVARVERAAGARAVVDAGTTERQLARLEQGALDLVIGDFAADSPWRTEVAIIEPLVERQVGGRRIGLSAVAANGENRWIALLEREVRDGGPAAP